MYLVEEYLYKFVCLVIPTTRLNLITNNLRLKVGLEVGGLRT